MNKALSITIFASFSFYFTALGYASNNTRNDLSSIEFSILKTEGMKENKSDEKQYTLEEVFKLG